MSLRDESTPGAMPPDVARRPGADVTVRTRGGARRRPPGRGLCSCPGTRWRTRRTTPARTQNAVRPVLGHRLAWRSPRSTCCSPASRSRARAGRAALAAVAVVLSAIDSRRPYDLYRDPGPWLALAGALTAGARDAVRPCACGRPARRLAVRCPGTADAILHHHPRRQPHRDGEPRSTAASARTRHGRCSPADVLLLVLALVAPAVLGAGGARGGRGRLPLDRAADPESDPAVMGAWRGARRGRCSRWSRTSGLAHGVRPNISANARAAIRSFTSPASPASSSPTRRSSASAASSPRCSTTSS